MRIQVIVELVPERATICLSFAHEAITIDEMKQKLYAEKNIENDVFRFMHGMKCLEDGFVPHSPQIIRAVLSNGLLGGKGGFGAMLRSQGKGAGQRQTTDFGACRDLLGRRLRHVNQEIAIKKWQEEEQLREQRKRDNIDERELPEEETPSGIPGWYLNTPSWAEGFGKKKSRSKRKRHTVLCNNWLQARARATPPEDAPIWWGCPRGQNCNFAHGESELRGEELTAYKAQKKDDALREKDQALASYLHPVAPTVIENEITDAFAAGLQRRKALQQQHAEKKLDLTSKMVYTPGETRWNNQASAAGSWLVPLHGNVHVTQTTNSENAAVVGHGTFGTATVFGCSLHQGQWYYEVEVVTTGVMQLGWADSTFQADDEEGDGVGDHAASWAYDGNRQLKWNNGISATYGKTWSAGDIVGCFLDADARVVQFSLNGELLGIAFDEIMPPTEKSDSSYGGFFPAFSLEENEQMRINIGDQPFVFFPKQKEFEKYTPVLQALIKADEAKPIVVTTSTTTESSHTPKSPSKRNENIAATTVPSTKSEPIQPATIPEPSINLMDIPSLDDLKALDANTLKNELAARGLKCGGTVDQRALRLWSIRALNPSEYPTKLLAPKK
ncbi:hypothetical protein THRCLA_01051 [Thraustotheca clavata]|uniref:Sde2 N-terminal ubiquitin domain-containing protein n=1 Tax=Thraustotheca clavata TaxID=74557 RepID=A0A1W0A9L8_9STRA|nr:hypothetical protein THRCLA_01051 [Thraustotheca clavata]